MLKMDISNNSDIQHEYNTKSKTLSNLNSMKFSTVLGQKSVIYDGITFFRKCYINSSQLKTLNKKQLIFTNFAIVLGTNLSICCMQLSTSHYKLLNIITYILLSYFLITYCILFLTDCYNISYYKLCLLWRC